VVGINSFNAYGTPGSGGSTGNSSYIGGDTLNENGADAHLVFQFQNLPFGYRMELNASNEHGYKGSLMKPYLTNKFLPSLTAAGVPDSVLWAPRRYVANKGNQATPPAPPAAADLIEDKLWLPTELEMFGVRTYSDVAWETDANQARLEYYNNDDMRVKYTSNYGTGPSAYFLASPITTTNHQFCAVFSTGYADWLSAGATNAVAPAFCVK
jgi:hypothetical protein